MKTEAVILNLRVARSTDFSDGMGQKKYGCMYFQQSFSGTFCNQPYFFHENTDLEVFRELYKSDQIWVLAGIFDEVEIFLRTIQKQKIPEKKAVKPPVSYKFKTFSKRNNRQKKEKSKL